MWSVAEFMRLESLVVSCTHIGVHAELIVGVCVGNSLGNILQGVISMFVSVLASHDKSTEWDYEQLVS